MSEPQPPNDTPQVVASTNSEFDDAYDNHEKDMLRLFTRFHADAPVNAESGSPGRIRGILARAEAKLKNRSL